MKRDYNILLLAFLIICFSKSSSGQTIYTIAGTGTAAYSGDGGPATLAQVNMPNSVATDAAGNVYFTDYGNHRIRKISTTGVVTTIAGTGFGGYLAAHDGNPATAAWIKWPTGIALDAAGNIYFSDYGNSIVRKISTSGIITTIAGVPGSSPAPPPVASGDGSPATSVVLGFLWGVAVDAAGNVYVADSWFNRIRKINTTTGIITTVAGNAMGLTGFSGDGGPATNGRLNEPTGVAVDATGNVYIGDYSNNRVRKVNTAGTISTIAGIGLPYGYAGDGGPATLAKLYYPKGIAVDNAGNIFISDWNNNCVRKINTSGIINTLAGTGVAGYSGDGVAPTSSQLDHPIGVTVRSDGDVFIADVANNRVRRIKIGNDPYFTWGTSKAITICPSEFSYIDTVLRVDDIDVGQTENWTPVPPAPAHGILVATYSTTSTGSTMTPTLTSYAPYIGYTGPDTFRVRVTDGTASDTITIYVTVMTFPNAGVISGPDSVCPGHTINLSETVTGGTWTSSNAALATVSGSGVVSGIAPGTFTITYSVSNYCGTATATFPMRVLATVPCISSVTKNLSENAAGITVTPNPSKGTFTIYVPTNNSGQVHLEITDVMGRVVSHYELPSNKPTDISINEPNGMYFISLSTQEGKYIKKIYIKH